MRVCACERRCASARACLPGMCVRERERSEPARMHPSLAPSCCKGACIQCCPCCKPSILCPFASLRGCIYARVPTFARRTQVRAHPRCAAVASSAARRKSAGVTDMPHRAGITARVQRAMYVRVLGLLRVLRLQESDDQSGARAACAAWRGADWCV
jgi:hypothetical protein